MWYAPTIATAATDEAITAAMVKAQSRINWDDDDALLTRLIAAAVSHVERRTGTYLTSRTVDAKCDGVSDLARLNIGPVTSITSIKYIDGDGVEQTVADTVYELRSDGIVAAVVLKYNQMWPSPRYGSQITVRAVAGYAANEAPADLTHAAISLVAHWYEHREAFGAADEAQEIPMMIEDLICNHRLNY